MVFPFWILCRVIHRGKIFLWVRSWNSQPARDAIKADAESIDKRLAEQRVGGKQIVPKKKKKSAFDEFPPEG